MPARRLPHVLRCLAAAGGLVLTGGLALAQTQPPAAGIYTCTDDTGHRLTADRPIAACAGKEQQVLNRDGSFRAILPPTLTSEERAEKEAREREAAPQRAAAADAVRRDRNLMARFPNEATHGKAREAALDTVRIAMKATEIRLRDLTAARKPLADEAEFYQGKPLPAKLKSALDSNDAAAEAQRASAANQEAELGRINKIYDAELERLRRLWSGAPAGSLGPLPAAHVLAPAATAASPPLVRRPASAASGR